MRTMQEQGDISFHGIDWNGPISEDNDDNIVDVPEIENPLPEEEFENLQLLVSPTAPSENFGVDIYMMVLEHVYQAMMNHND